MNSLIRSSLTVFVLVVVAVSGALAQQPKQSDYAFLQAKSDRFVNYTSDFLAFGRATKGDDRATSYGLYDAVSAVHQYIFAAQSLVNIYDNLSCRVDRENTWAIIRRDFDYYIAQIDNHVLTVNEILSNAKVPAMATSGTQLKTDMRELKAFFESVRPKREPEK